MPESRAAEPEPSAPPGKRKLSTAEERREAVLEAAMPIFAEKGFHAAPTAEIARGAGISQAYLFRLFPTKLELFVAVVEVTRREMLATFKRAADDSGASGGELLEAMGIAYGDLVVSHRDYLMVQLHAQAVASTVPPVNEAMRRCFADFYSLVAERTGVGPEELQAWFAGGMLINVMTALHAEQVDEPWAEALTAFDGDCFG